MKGELHTVTDIVERTPGSGLYVVFVDATPVGALTAATIGALGVRVHDTVDVRGMDQLRDAVAEQVVFDKGVELLAMRARSARDLQQRLVRKGAGRLHAQSAVQRLLALGYLNDQTYADGVVANRLVGAGASKRQVKQDLVRRGVAKEVAEAAIARAVELHGVDERDAVLTLARKRLKVLARHDAATRRRRLYGFLARRGYDTEAIGDVLRRLDDAESDGGSDTIDEV